MVQLFFGLVFSVGPIGKFSTDALEWNLPQSAAKKKHVQKEPVFLNFFFQAIKAF